MGASLLLLRYRMDEGYLTGELSFVYKGWQAYTRFYGTAIVACRRAADGSATS